MCMLVAMPLSPFCLEDERFITPCEAVMAAMNIVVAIALLLWALLSAFRNGELCNAS